MILMLKKLKNWLENESIILYVGIASLSIVFFIAGIGKILDAESFVKSLRPLPFLLKVATVEIYAFGVFLGVIEISLAILIWIEKTRKIAAMSILLLLIGFIFFISDFLINDISSTYCCFSLLSERVITPISLFEDFVLVLFSFYIVKHSH